MNPELTLDLSFNLWLKVIIVIKCESIFRQTMQKSFGKWQVLQRSEKFLYRLFIWKNKTSVLWKKNVFFFGFEFHKNQKNEISNDRTLFVGLSFSEKKPDFY